MAYGRFKKSKRPEGPPGGKKFIEALRDRLLYDIGSLGGIPFSLLASDPLELQRIKSFSKAAKASKDCSRALNGFAEAQKDFIEKYPIDRKVVFKRDRGLL